MKRSQVDPYYGVPTGYVPRLKTPEEFEATRPELEAEMEQILTGSAEVVSARAKQVGGSHYANKVIQPWDAMQAWMTPEQFKGYLLGNIIKYAARFQDKGGREDLEKLQHYLDKLLEVVQ